MNITFIAFGTRGDVQPSAALARGLVVRGHRVRMVASRHFADWLEARGIEAAPTDIDIQALMASAEGVDWVERGPLAQIQAMKRLFARHGGGMARDAWRASRDADLVISNFTSDVYAASIAEKLGVPHVSAPLQPVLRATASGAATANAPLPRRDSRLNYLFGKVMIEPFPWRLMGRVNNRFRREMLGLAAQSARESRTALRRMLVVQGFSPHVVPPPVDWPASIHTTGYWFLDDEPSWEPPAALSRFLEAGDPPVFLGFGSMTGRDPAGLTRLILDAVAQCGTRAIVQSGWAGLGDLPCPPNVFQLDAAPHAWLFPRVRVVVHHGGAGTTGEGLRAGRPTVVVPHMADQPFWGARVHALGVGPRPIPKHRLTADRLAAAIHAAATDRAMVDRAAALGALIRAEDGVGHAAGLIERHARG